MLNKTAPEDDPDDDCGLGVTFKPTPSRRAKPTAAATSARVAGAARARATKAELHQGHVDRALTPKQEAFAQLVLKGSTVAGAYREAYGVPVVREKVAHANGLQVLKRPHVSKRIAVLRAEVAMKSAVTAEEINHMLRVAFQLAVETKQASAAALAAFNLAKVNGMVIDRAQIEAVLRRPSDDPSSPDTMSEEEWLASSHVIVGSVIDRQIAGPEAAEPEAVEPQHGDRQVAEPEAAEPQPDVRQAAEPEAAEPQPDARQAAAEPQPDPWQAAGPEAAESEPQPVEPKAAEPEREPGRPRHHPRDRRGEVDLDAGTVATTGKAPVSTAIAVTVPRKTSWS